MHVMLAEDDAETMAFVERGLGELGHRIDIASDGGAAVMRGMTGGYDVIVLDRMLPVLDGIAVLRRLRAAAVTTPVLMLTALDGIPDRVHGLDAGADDYLVKPFALPELAARLNLPTPLMRLRNQVGRVDGAAERSIEKADSLLALFAAILRIAEVEGGGSALARAPLDLSELAIDVAEAYQPALLDSGHHLASSITPGVWVAGDRERLAQVMADLLDNARVHTPAGTAVRLSLNADPQAARISVADDGPGVPTADRERILRRFARGEASRTTPGHGLGLSLVCAVAAAHGGDVEVADASPGLRVTVRLPRLPH